MNAFWSSCLRQLEQELPPQQFFARMARLMMDFYEKNADYVRLLLFSGLERHELSRMFHEKHACAHFDYLSGYVRRQIELGTFRDVDPLIAAATFTGMIANEALHQVLHPDQALVPDREQLLNGMVDIFLRGVMK
mgnify:CR=1 FL=1